MSLLGLLTACEDSSTGAISRLEQLAADEDCEIRQLLSWSMGRIKFDPETHDSVESLLADADSRMYDDKLRKQGAAG